MEYLLLIYVDPAEYEKLEEAEAKANVDAYWAYEEAVQKAGVTHGSNALHDIDTATSVRVRDGKTIITDGPFAETKEVLGGYYLIEANSLAEAQEWAAKIPDAVRGTIEVRPVIDFSGQG